MVAVLVNDVLAWSRLATHDLSTSKSDKLGEVHPVYLHIIYVQAKLLNKRFGEDLRRF
jgi:hypothetical protein